MNFLKFFMKTFGDFVRITYLCNPNQESFPEKVGKIR